MSKDRLTRERMLDEAQDAGSIVSYDDRKESDLTQNDFCDALDRGVVSIDELMEAFKQGILKNYEPR